MPIRYFHKELVNRSVSHQGVVIKWDLVEDANGILQTDDHAMATGLGQLAAKRVGGVREITEAQYGEYKKKATSKLFAPVSEHNSGPRLISRDRQKLVPQAIPVPVAPVAAVTAPVAVAAPVAGETSPATPVAAPVAPTKPKIAVKKKGAKGAAGAA